MIQFQINKDKTIAVALYLLEKAQGKMGVDSFFSIINRANIEHVRISGRPIIGGTASDWNRMLIQCELISDCLVRSRIYNKNLDLFSKSDIVVLNQVFEENPTRFSEDIKYEDYIDDQELLNDLQDNSLSIFI